MVLALAAFGSCPYTSRRVLCPFEALQLHQDSSVAEGLRAPKVRKDGAFVICHRFKLPRARFKATHPRQAMTWSKPNSAAVPTKDACFCLNIAKAHSCATYQHFHSFESFSCVCAGAYCSSRLQRLAAHWTQQLDQSTRLVARLERPGLWCGSNESLVNKTRLPNAQESAVTTQTMHTGDQRPHQSSTTKTTTSCNIVDKMPARRHDSLFCNSPHHDKPSMQIVQISMQYKSLGRQAPGNRVRNMSNTMNVNTQPQGY